jgi:hypothetical protein
MGKAKDQRSEKRLRYRWHTRFALSPRQKPLSGQMVDVSSKGMALLYHNDESCPGPDQLITTNFGVPHFDSGGSFDTVFFNRIGRVCRIDNLTSKVNRIAIQFAEPLFFKPGEQDISDSEAKQRLEAKALSVTDAKETTTKTQRKVNADNHLKSSAKEITRLYNESLARLEERIQYYAEAKARAEEKAKAETKARAKAEAKAKTEARLRAKAEKKAELEALKRAKIEAELKKKADLFSEQLEKIKTQAAQEIANIKAEYKSKSPEEKSLSTKSIKDKTKSSGEGILMDKLDKFITDKNRIF